MDFVLWIVGFFIGAALLRCAYALDAIAAALKDIASSIKIGKP